MWVLEIEPRSSNSGAMSPAFAMTLHLVFLRQGLSLNREIISTLTWLAIKPRVHLSVSLCLCSYRCMPPHPASASMLES